MTQRTTSSRYISVYKSFAFLMHSSSLPSKMNFSPGFRPRTKLSRCPRVSRLCFQSCTSLLALRFLMSRPKRATRFFSPPSSAAALLGCVLLGRRDPLGLHETLFRTLLKWGLFDLECNYIHQLQHLKSGGKL